MYYATEPVSTSCTRPVVVAAVLATPAAVGLSNATSVVERILLWVALFFALVLAGLVARLAFRRSARASAVNPELGISAVYLSREEYRARRRDLYQQSQKSIRILSIFAELTPEHRELLESSLQRGVAVRILMLDPSTSYAKTPHPLQLANMGANISASIQPDVDTLTEVSRRRQREQWTGRLSLKLYSEEPKWCLYFFDDQLFAAPYLYATAGSESFCLHAHWTQHHATYRQFSRHYDQLWSAASATPIGE